LANFVYIATSLDGYIADPDGGLDWLMNIPNPDGGDFGFAAFMDGVDALVMGRNTFEKVVGFGGWIYTKPVFVLSSKLEAVPENLADKAQIIRGDIASVVADLNAQGFENLYVDGGKVVQGFLAADLIDTMVITTATTVLGGGISLFGALDSAREFQLEKTEVLTPQLVKNTYQRLRS
jgi:dihydrofolate reductase